MYTAWLNPNKVKALKKELSRLRDVLTNKQGYGLILLMAITLHGATFLSRLTGSTAVNAFLVKLPELVETMKARHPGVVAGASAGLPSLSSLRRRRARAAVGSQSSPRQS